MIKESVVSEVQLSVVIGFRDWGLHRIELAVRSIQESFKFISGEVIISDYGSEDRQANSDLASKLGAKYVFSEDSVWSRSRALNAGFSIAEGRLLISTDADMIFSPRSFELIWNKFQKDPLSAFFLQCRDLPEGKDDLWVVAHKDSWQLFEQISQIRPRWGMGGMMAISREGYEKIRGFDERLHTYGGEDLDFAKRARRAGFKTVWINDDDVRMYHMWHPATIREVEKTPEGRQAVEFNRSIVYNDCSFVRNYLSWKYKATDVAPLVTVAICTKNRAGLLKEAIDSVLVQTMQDFEIVVVDDGGCDNTSEVVASYNDPRIRYEWQEQRGISSARNHAADISRGIFTAVLDDDDLMHPRRLEWQIDGLEPGTVGNCGSFLNFDNITGETELYVSKIPTYESTLEKGSAPGHSTWLLKTSLIRQLRYDEKLTSGVDNNLMLRVMRSGAKVTHVGKPVTLRRMHVGQVTVTDSVSQTGNAASALKFLQWRLNPGDLNNVKIISQERGEYPKTSSRESLIEEAVPYLPDSLVKRNLFFEGGEFEKLSRAEWDGKLVISSFNLGEANQERINTYTLLGATYRDMLLARSIGVDFVASLSEDCEEDRYRFFEFSVKQVLGELDGKFEPGSYALFVTTEGSGSRSTSWNFEVASISNGELKLSNLRPGMIIAERFMEDLREI